MSDLSTARCHPVHSALLAVAVLAIAGCGGGSGGSTIGGNGGGSGGSGWSPGVFLDDSTFAGQCVNPRSGTDPATGQPYGDVQGTRTDENNFLRSWSNDTYLWYDEIADRDPSQFETPAYFDLLKTTATTASGAPKDKFHFTYPTDEWFELSQSGTSAGYGVQWAILSSRPPREIFVAYTDPGTPAASAGLLRGAEVLEVDGVDVANGSDTDTLNGGLFPDAEGETHNFRVRDPDGSVRDLSMTSATVTSVPVQNVKTLQTQAGPVGYMLFNDHIRPAEQALIDAVTQLSNDGVTDLVIDLRYNGGGFLFIASELSFMVAGPNATGGRTFEVLRFNDKHPSTNPVTGQAIAPIPFYNTSTGGQALPTLNLSRVFVLTGAGTCSASESIMNSLRGVDVDVIQIGTTTCGKPYGFYPEDNCGTTYFTIQFRGENDKGFGDYSDGFTPQNAGGTLTTPLPGCQVADDFTQPLGDPAEARLAAAIDYIEGRGCPAPSSIRVPGATKPAGATPPSRVQLPRSPLREMRILDERVPDQ